MRCKEVVETLKVRKKIESKKVSSKKIRKNKKKFTNQRTYEMYHPV